MLSPAVSVYPARIVFRPAVSVYPARIVLRPAVSVYPARIALRPVVSVYPARIVLSPAVSVYLERSMLKTPALSRSGTWTEPMPREMTCALSQRRRRGCRGRAPHTTPTRHT